MTTDQRDTSATDPKPDHHANQPAPAQRTPAKRKARQLAKHLRGEHPDYAYLKEVFRHLRDELGVEVTTAPAKLPYVPSQESGANRGRRSYERGWPVIPVPVSCSLSTGCGLASPPWTPALTPSSALPPTVCPALPIHVDPPSGDLDVGFIGEPLVARGVSAGPGRVDHQGREALYPAVDRDVGQASFTYHEVTSMNTARTATPCACGGLTRHAGSGS
jgi:hypothetical protein